MILCNWSWRSSTHKFGGQRLFYFKLYPLIGYGVFSEAPHGAKKIIGPILQEEVPPHKPGREATVGTYLFGEISINQLHKKCIRNQHQHQSTIMHQHQHQSTVRHQHQYQGSTNFWESFPSWFGLMFASWRHSPLPPKASEQPLSSHAKGPVGEIKPSMDCVDGGPLHWIDPC